MLPKTITKYSNLLLTIYRLAQQTPVAECQDALLDALKDGIPFDSSMWGTGTMSEAGIDIHSLHLHHETTDMITSYNAVKHLDTAASRVARQTVATVAFNSDVEYGAPEKREMLDYCNKFGHRNTLITSNINPHTKFAQWLSLYRKDAKKICTEDEALFLTNLAPHLMQALAINRLVHMDRLVGDNISERWSVAIADTRGLLYHSGKELRNLIELEWGKQNHERLPSPLMESIHTSSQFLGRHILVVRSLEQGMIFLKVRKREKVDDLSARECLVAQLLATGMSQREVAAKLARTTHTVNTQVRSIYAKLGIDNAVLLPMHLALLG